MTVSEVSCRRIVIGEMTVGRAFGRLIDMVKFLKDNTRLKLSLKERVRCDQKINKKVIELIVKIF